ncbi:hypothetical protein PAXINDRAFT_84599 [Paxillus involutus ATCC 200175]|uniref:Uncharacterized protein n=1 Tax=Paxillus involutus ATCC 200175 TaxID=664439 RepID=A0A0C9TL62_PAXIN|nr:hypothetical protein PAXINDRAFT_84599 [Paxillus involutus ATCC 200175]
MDRSKERPPMTIRGTVINSSPTHHFLGILVDNMLRWHAHARYAIGKGTAYVMQLRRLALSVKGIPLSLMKQLYTSVALLKMLYTVDLWFRPLYEEAHDTAHRGSIGLAKRLSKVQHLAIISITGAMCTMATDVLEVHAKIMQYSLFTGKIYAHPLRPGPQLSIPSFSISLRTAPLILSVHNCPGILRCVWADRVLVTSIEND